MQSAVFQPDNQEKVCSNILSQSHFHWKTDWGANSEKPQDQKYWLVKIKGFFPLSHYLNGSDGWFLSCTSYFSMLKAREFQYEGQVRSFNEKLEFFPSNACNNKSLSFISVKIVQKQRTPLQCRGCEPMWQFSIFTHTAQWLLLQSAYLILP